VPVGCSTGPERNSSLNSIILQTTDSYARSTTSSLKISSTAPQERRPAALRHRSHLSGQHSTAQLSLLKAESAAEVFKRTPFATTKGLASCKLLPPATNTLSPSLRPRLRLASWIVQLLTATLALSSPYPPLAKPPRPIRITSSSRAHSQPQPTSTSSSFTTSHDNLPPLSALGPGRAIYIYFQDRPATQTRCIHLAEVVVSLCRGRWPLSQQRASLGVTRIWRISCHFSHPRQPSQDPGPPDPDHGRA
jgi:hypothetical protein